MGALKTEQGARLREAQVERAKCAWLLASYLAARAEGADQRVVMQTTGKVGRGGDDKTSRARKLACYLATVVADVTQARLSDANGMDRSSILQASAWVEDQRDKPDYDALVEGLERSLIGMAVKVVLARLGEVAPELGDVA